MPDFNDTLENLFAGDTGPVRTTAVVDRPAAREYVAKVTAPEYVQTCHKCRGSGQTRWGACFACRGAGSKTFKTSPEARAANREKAADRKVAAAATAWDDFAAAQPVAAAWIVAKADSFDFAAKLREAVARFGSLTEGQLVAVQRCVDRDATRAADRAKAVTEAPAVNVAKLEQAFATARSKAERPGQLGVMVKPIRLTSSDETGKLTVRFTPGSAGSQWEGMLFAKSEAGKKLGHIKAGKFIRKFDCTEVEAAAVLNCAQDPEKAAVAFGKAWSRCGICGKGLLNDESIARGMGPTCAERFGW